MSLLPLDGRAADVHGTTFEDEESTTEVVAAPDSVPIRYTAHGTGSPTLVFVRDMSTGPPEVGIGAISSSFAHASEIVADLEELNLPVIAINSDNASTDIESMERHGVDVVLLSGVGHFMVMEDPERFNSTLMGALERFAE